MKAREALQRLLARSGITPQSERAHQFQTYLSLLEKWNARVNLTASTEWEAVGRLFEEALWASTFYPEGPTLHLDIGSGPGFPALPLRIVRPKMSLWMLESRGKKAAFLETVAAELGLANVVVVNERLEGYLTGESERTKWDCISLKGVKLTEKELHQVLASTTDAAQIWLFHGRDLPLENPEQLNRHLKLQRREAFPRERSWFLSIYEKP